jgi:hypothetical protein
LGSTSFVDALIALETSSHGFPIVVLGSGETPEGFWIHMARTLLSLFDWAVMILDRLAIVPDPRHLKGSTGKKRSTTDEGHPYPNDGLNHADDCDLATRVMSGVIIGGDL